MLHSYLFLPSCFDSILLRPSQVGFAITEAHHHSLGLPYSNNSVRRRERGRLARLLGLFRVRRPTSL
jgi:hypothetical protein